MNVEEQTNRSSKVIDWLNPTFPPPPVVYQSYDYEKFKMVEYNRDLSSPNLKKLFELNRKEFQLHNFPLLVDKDLLIIDGQHRFEVSRYFGAPIYYIIDDTIKCDVDTIHSLNIAGKKHMLHDKVLMYSKAGKKGCTEICRLHDSLKHRFSMATVAECVSLLGSPARKHIDDKKDLPINPLGVKLLHFLDSFEDTRMHQSRAVRGFIMVFNSYRDIKPEAFFDKFSLNYSRFGSLISPRDFFRIAVLSYNYNRTEKYRLRLKV